MTNFYNNQYDRITSGKPGSIPLVSTGIDSRRAYEWEVSLIVHGLNNEPSPFFLAAKRVSGAGFKIDKITADRVNDKAFYAGKATPDEVTIVFDNIKQANVLSRLYEAFQGVYDPTTGCFSTATEYKGAMKIMQLDECRAPITETRYIGVFMTSWKPSDFDYAQNEFHTITCTFSYDFVVQDETAVG